MRFAFSPEQVELRDAVRDLLEKECPPAAVRDAWTNDTGRSPAAWSALAAMGVLGALAPAAHGGLGLSEVDLVLVLEETGRHALPEPIVETALVAAPEGWVDARGAQAASVTLPESPFAPWAASVERLVLLAADGVRVVDRSAVELRPRASVDGARRPCAVVTPEVAPVAGLAECARAFRRGVVGHAAQLLGLADRMIDMTVDYARQRVQFGVPIGSQQAVKHHLAGARTRLEFARPLVYRAAVSLAGGDPDPSLHASMAKVLAGEAAALAARVALQCHGAIGYTTEYDLHLYMKRAWVLERAWGSTAWHRGRVAGAILAAD
jgi:alkylation response protein AidB-like acyl-CoA dehydrogenase